MQISKASTKNFEELKSLKSTLGFLPSQKNNRK